MRILIVEDDCLLAEAVSDYFSAKGWQTEEAHDGNSALEMATSQCFLLRRECWKRTN